MYLMLNEHELCEQVETKWPEVGDIRGGVGWRDSDGLMKDRKNQGEKTVHLVVSITDSIFANLPTAKICNPQINTRSIFCSHSWALAKLGNTVLIQVTCFSRAEPGSSIYPPVSSHMIDRRPFNGLSNVTLSYILCFVLFSVKNGPRT